MQSVYYDFIVLIVSNSFYDMRLVWSFEDEATV